MGLAVQVKYASSLILWANCYIVAPLCGNQWIKIDGFSAGKRMCGIAFKPRTSAKWKVVFASCPLIYARENSCLYSNAWIELNTENYVAPLT